MKNKNSSCSIKESDIPKNIKCDTNTGYYEIDLINKKLYKNWKYFGDIIKIESDIITVKCNNGNRYMKDQIITIQIAKQND